MEIDPDLAARALAEGLKKYPRFESFSPRLIARPLFKGHALMLEYGGEAPGDSDAWEFQNAVVREYKRLAGG